MEAKVTKSFPGRPDDEVMTRQFEVGDIVKGDLARVAVENGWAEEVESPEVDDGGKSSELAKLTVPQLKAMATELNVDLEGAEKKADIIAKLEAATAA
ncbi:hypothetical protein [Rhizobium sp. AAP43]|uniref:hypothetical protein n=1 Tax=Rhizobium sp. AAP43 TaxID=1523420 RepID=UPI0006B90BCE|nr:hypothetical protein [Rhizobium sp. AAP43]KPF47074.1 hypothetical protein IP76_01875 [Rhizobium sp. AAP43]